MGVFFGLCDANLAFAGALEDFAHGVAEVVFFEHHSDSAKVGVVAGHGHEVQVGNRSHSVRVQPALAERLGEFAAAVGAVVEKEDGVPGANAALRIEDVRKEEFVGRSGGVGGL